MFSAFTSYRIHSIYVLRLFNDPIAILFLYVALNLFLDNKWTIGSVFFSLGVSVKMNILLFAPAILMFYTVNLGFVKTMVQLFVCGIVQLILGAPFLATYPINYIKGSFDIGRVFEHKWTVNYRFLSRDIFEDKYFHIGLLIGHLVLLAIFVRPCFKYMQSYTRLRMLEKQLQPQIDHKNAELKSKKGKNIKSIKEEDDTNDLTVEQQKFLDSFEKTIQKDAAKRQVKKKTTDHPERFEIFFEKSTQLAILPIFLTNFIGIICARSLHYQFYVWYFHSLPYLVWFAEFDVKFKFLLLGLIELAWNTYPSTDYSSLILHACHIALLFGIAKHLFKRQPSEKIKE